MKISIFVFHFNFKSVFIFHPKCSFLSFLSLNSLSLPYSDPKPSPPPFLFRKRQVNYRYNKSWSVEQQQDYVTLLVIRMGGVTQYEEQGTKRQQKSRRQPLLPLLEVPEEDQDIQLSYISRGPKLVLCWLPGCLFRFYEPL